MGNVQRICDTFLNYETFFPEVFVDTPVGFWTRWKAGFLKEKLKIKKYSYVFYVDCLSVKMPVVGVK